MLPLDIVADLSRTLVSIFHPNSNDTNTQAEDEEACLANPAALSPPLLHHIAAAPRRSHTTAAAIAVSAFSLVRS